MSKKLLIVLFCAVFMLTACQSKIPEGVDKEFYDDIKGISLYLIDNIDNYKNNPNYSLMTTPEYKMILEMHDNYNTYSKEEQKILDHIWFLYDSVNFYYSGSDKFDVNDIVETGNKLGELMNFKIDVSKLIK